MDSLFQATATPRLPCAGAPRPVGKAARFAEADARSHGSARPHGEPNAQAPGDPSARQDGQMLADPNSGNAGGDRAEGAPDLPRCIGLWVPRLKLAWSAHQHQQDDRPVPPTMIPRERVQIGQAEAERAQPHAPYAQEVAAADTGRGSHHALTDRDHRGLSSLAPAKPTDLTTLTGVQRTWAVSSATGASRFSRSVWRYCLPLVGEK